jgi:hypothetical protein
MKTMSIIVVSFNPFLIFYFIFPGTISYALSSIKEVLSGIEGFG